MPVQLNNLVHHPSCHQVRTAYWDEDLRTSDSLDCGGEASPETTNRDYSPASPLQARVGWRTMVLPGSCLGIHT